MDSSIGADKFSRHEPHVGMEPIESGCPGGRVRTGPGQVEIRLPDDPVEIEDQ